VAWAAYSQNPPDARSACLAAVDLPTLDDSVAAGFRQLGTPTLFACYGNELYWFQHEASRTRLIERITSAQVANFFSEHKEQFHPQRIYRAKTSGKFKPTEQLYFVDAGLMPLLEQSSGEWLGRKVESLVSTVHEAMPKTRSSKDSARWVFQSVFWLLAARLLRDKSVPSFKTVNVSDPDDVFDRVGRHYSAAAPPATSATQRNAMLEAARVAEGFPSLANITTESLAYVYENTLVSQEVRDALGTHRTPSWLVAYIIWQLAPWIEEMPVDDRHVLEPASGHSAFLVAAVRLLRQLIPTEFDETRRQRYLRSHVHGIEIDDFAREIGRLSLTLADVPNSNGWDLADADMYAGNDLARRVKRSGIVLANPPFEDFTDKERRYYKKQPGLGIFHNNKAAELFARVIQNLPAEGMFGLVLPESVLASSEGRSFRSQLVRNFELREVCLLPDKLFENSEIESAVILGRRRNPSLNHVVRSQRVYDWDLSNFEQKLEVSTESTVPQSAFLLRPDVNLRLPDLYEVWASLRSFPRMETSVHVQKGFEFKGGGELSGRDVTSDQPKKGWTKAYLRADDHYSIYSTPSSSWVDYSSRTLRRTGAVPSGPQVLLNYARVSRKPWRLKATIDIAGIHFTTSFLMFRPHRFQEFPLPVLWAILNSPVANAYAFSITSKRQVVPKEWRDFPLPRLSQDDIASISAAADKYRNAAIQLNDGRSTSIAEQAVRALLLKMDAAVLRAYSLPPALEQQMLAIFEDVERPGVGCDFRSYAQASTAVHLPLHLRLALPRFHELASLRLAGKIKRRQQAELNAIEDSFDSYERESPGNLAFQSWLGQFDKHHADASARLDSIEARINGSAGGGGA
jgi:N-6 DNA Methylase